VRGIRIDPFGWAVLVSAALIVGVVPRAFAADMTSPAAETPAVESTPVQSGPFRPGFPIGEWMVYPSIFVGAIFDDNIRQAANGTERDSHWGVRVTPNFIETYAGGIHQTTLYQVVDARLFPGAGSPPPGQPDVNANSVSATAGFRHGYEAMRDLTFNFYGDYTRETDIFNSALNFNNGAIGPTPGSSPAPILLNPFGTSPSVNPVAYNQFSGGAAFTKTFGEGFLTLGGDGAHIAWDRTNSPLQIAEDGLLGRVTGRLGYNVTPQFYVFAEGLGIFQHVENSTKVDTSGYRAIGGIGSADPNSLFRGEIWGGYQFQHENLTTNLIIPGLTGGDTHDGVFGGSLYYYPTRYWTIMALAQEQLGVTLLGSTVAPVGTPTRTFTSILQTTYHLSRVWWVGVRGGYTRAQYIGTSRLDNGWMAGASFNYEVWRNLVATLDYQHTANHSNVAFSSFDDNRYSAGLTYQY
jgi:hypothetical protein